MTHRDRRVAARRLARQHVREWLADDGRPSDDGHVRALRLDTGDVEQPLHPVGRAGLEPRAARCQSPDVLRVQRVDVLLGVDPLQRLVPRHVLWQGQLHQDTVDVRVVVQVCNRVVQFAGGRVGVDPDVDPLDSHVLTGALLHRDVRLAGGVGTHQDSRQPRASPAVGERLDRSRQVGPDPLGHLGPVDDGGHGRSTGTGANQPDHPAPARTAPERTVSGRRVTRTQSPAGRVPPRRRAPRRAPPARHSRGSGRGRGRRHGRRRSQPSSNG